MLKTALRYLIRCMGYDIARRRPYVERGEVGYLNFRAVAEFYISHANNPENIQLVQIGANDGRMHDPIYNLITDYTVKALLVEPLPEVFTRLKDNYEAYKSHVSFENAAIAEKSGEMKFYALSENLDFPEKDFNFSGMSSLSRDHVIRNFKRYAPYYGVAGSAEDHIRETYVPVLSFNDLMQKHDIKDIDILQIDAEGYDWQILRTIDFDTIRPCIIHFEHSNLTPADKSLCWKKLRSHGYYCAIDGTDSVCLKIGRQTGHD